LVSDIKGRKFGAKKDEVNGGWRKLHSEELQNLYPRHVELSRLNDGTGKACSMSGGEEKNAYSIWVGMPDGKRPLGRRRHRWIDNIKMHFREIG
jgi:hypothetical protein